MLLWSSLLELLLVYGLLLPRHKVGVPDACSSVALVRQINARIRVLIGRVPVHVGEDLGEDVLGLVQRVRRLVHR